MSRIGKMPVLVPKGISVSIDLNQLTIKGPLGMLFLTLNALVTIKNEVEKLLFFPVSDEIQANAMTGTMRALVANMILGVSTGFQKKLLLKGVGYRAAVAGTVLTLQVGYSHSVVINMPEGIKIECPTQTEILIKGSDKQKVGQIASEIRAVRPPEPYKGKGICYSDEVIVIKETKKK
jgi:large subunit ribosomal protein L6